MSKVNSVSGTKEILILDDFFKSNASVHCSTREEAIEFFRLLVSKSIVWKTDGPLDDINWEEYKEKTYYSLQNGKLCFWHDSIYDNAIEFDTIPKIEIYIAPIALPDVIDFEHLTNQYAISCPTEEESVELFNKFGKHGIRQTAHCGICGENNTVWDMYKINTAYVVANKKSAYAIDINLAKELGYKIIKQKDFK